MNWQVYFDVTMFKYDCIRSIVLDFIGLQLVNRPNSGSKVKFSGKFHDNHQGVVENINQNGKKNINEKKQYR